MKNLSIIIQIAIINIIVMSFFIGVFIYRNYTIVSNQLVLLEDEKIDSIVKTLTPIISINLTFGLEENIKELIKDNMQNHNEVIGIRILNSDKKIVYEEYKSDIKKARVYNIDLYDAILKTKIGDLNLYYTFSSIYSELLSEFNIFLFLITIFFILSLLISSLLIKFNLKPLKSLKDKMLNYSLDSKTIFEEENFKNEISLINNSAYKMIKKIEEEVEKRILYEKDIMQKTRLASMGEMLDNIAHQWRQPLMKINAILLNTDRNIELKNYDEKYLKDRLDDISNTVYFMSNTIETFREFLNPNKTKQEFKISESIEKSLKVLNTSLKGINIDIDKKEIFINQIESEFMQVIISILSNAIEIFNERNIENKLLSISIYDDEKNIFISIGDNAGGIDKNNLDKLFDPYFTTKHKTGGTGMGLYISKIIMMNSFNGDIKVEDSSLGAKFILNIPKQKGKEDE
ncbi:sensor histidine kinase [Aliarcobacter butzleri]|uniref:histidine kinase n=1 Tax=Aliarcobacter butzleri TaxID=28197 RepID=A0AAW7PN48_9BACT|nr:HAMP domain-containing sensor histidine kinase [Aliarcobacter butzleri]MDN5062815.1 HAMP domain-containing sensor histidine kinase [Aliarcobacter butzleri]MDN5066900.1 HAMP domain-containing sensor histidine kinase [Aliarcobacter butzleri]